MPSFWHGNKNCRWIPEHLTINIVILAWLWGSGIPQRSSHCLSSVDSLSLKKGLVEKIYGILILYQLLDCHKPMINASKALPTPLEDYLVWTFGHLSSQISSLTAFQSFLFQFVNELSLIWEMWTGSELVKACSRSKSLMLLIGDFQLVFTYFSLTLKGNS